MMQSYLLFSVACLAFMFGFNPYINAQATNSTCQNATMIGATNPGYPLPVNQPAAPQGNNYACLGTQPNPLWFYFQLNTAGDIELLLSNTANVDVDFILYGPFPSAAAAFAGCGNLGRGSSGGAVVDCSFSGAANEWVNASGNAGDVYMLLVTNFSNQPTAGNTQIVLSNSTATLVNPYVGAPVVVGTCANLPNGSISTNVTNGTSPYAYIWSNGATTSDISGLSSGVYGFTVTDATGATFANNSINVPASPASYITNSPVSICAGDSALIYGQWQYASGTYYDTVSNPSGCDDIYSTFLTVNQTYNNDYLDLCVGDSAFVAGAWQFASGYYLDTFTNSNGCDSIIETYVSFYVCSPVWAGDADDNLIVDGDDWLQLGLANGFWGNVRANASINWIAQPAIDWGWNVGAAEVKHADCNGDGQVDDSDTLAVVQNYSLTHVRGGGNFTVNSGATVQLIPQQNVYNVGDLVKIDVVLGQNSAALSDAYGYFFKIDIGNIFRAGSLQFTPNNSFLGTNASVWTLSKELSAANQIDIAQVRHNQAGVNGFGKVGEISFILSNNAGNSSPVLGFVNDKIINSSNMVIPVTTSAATFNVNPTSVQNSTNYNFAAKIVPNPVQNQAYLEFELAENSAETQIRIINMLGQVQHNQVLTQLNAGKHRVELQTNLAAGTYFVEISNQRQTTRIPFVKVQ